MSFFSKLFGGGTTSELNTNKAKHNEHYALKCKECDFVHHIPRDCSDNTFKFVVEPDKVNITCVYGPSGSPRQFTVTLQMNDFFSCTPVPVSKMVLNADISNNMKVLHAHILFHCDPLYLSVLQSSNRTDHKYRKQPEGSTYVKFTANHGIDIVGKIDVSKAEIPGI